MSVIFSENFGGAAAGTAIATTNTAFDQVTGTNVPTMDATSLVTGISTCALYNYTAQTGYGQETVSGSSFYVRFFIKPATLFSGNTVFSSIRAAGVNQAALRQDTTGVWTLMNGGTVASTTTTAMTAGTVYRVEWDYTGATQALRLFAGNATTPLETITGATLNGTVDSWRLFSATSATGSGRVTGVVVDNASTPGPLVTGTTGSVGDPLQESLNRLAKTTGLDAQGAANKWAGTTGLDLLGALNAKNGTKGLGLNGVCNALAGTTGLDAPAALVKILA